MEVAHMEIRDAKGASFPIFILRQEIPFGMTKQGIAKMLSVFNEVFTQNKKRASDGSMDGTTLVACASMRYIHCYIGTKALPIDGIKQILSLVVSMEAPDMWTPCEEAALEDDEELCVPGQLGLDILRGLSARFPGVEFENDTESSLPWDSDICMQNGKPVYVFKLPSLTSLYDLPTKHGKVYEVGGSYRLATTAPLFDFLDEAPEDARELEVLSPVLDDLERLEV